MSTKDVNPESLTFEEWVCAAGVARFGHITSEGFMPYTISGIDLSSSAKKRWSRTMYPHSIRKAWLAGEDPTEHRNK